jgi:hypothetical protein
MPYTRIQFIGHVINTGARIDKTTRLWSYTGLESEADDISGRLQLVAEALTEASKRVTEHNAQGEDILKVYMMPEFFFRGPKGAYTFDELIGTTQAIGLLPRIQKFLLAPQFNNWLFVGGTALGRSLSPGCPSKFEAPYTEFDFPQEVTSASLCQECGPKSASSENANVVVKYFKSTVDFLSAYQSPGFLEKDPARPGLLWERVGHMAPLAVPGQPNPTEVRPPTPYARYTGQEVFKVDGKNWALEICLDHAMKRLKNSNPPPIGCQLITSCGMSIQPDAVAVKDGYVLNVDGSDICADKHNGDSQGKAHSGLWEYQKGAFVRNFSPVGYYPVVAGSDKLKNLFAYGNGELHFYDTVPFPA